MMRVFIHRLIWLVSFGFICLLTGCGSGSSGSLHTPYVPTSSSYARALNAYVYQGSWSDLNVNVGGAPVGKSLTFGNASWPYTKVKAGTGIPIELSLAGGNPSPETIHSTLSKNQYYTVIATANGSNLGGTVLTDDPTPPASGNFKVRIIHLASKTGPVAIYFAVPGTAIDDPKKPVPALVSNLTAGTVSPYLQVPAGTYNLIVTEANDPSSVIAEEPSWYLDEIQEGNIFTAVLFDPYNTPPNGSVGTTFNMLLDFMPPSTMSASASAPGGELIDDSK